MENFLIFAGISLIIPAAYVLSAPKSRFWYAVMLWLTWPAIVYFVRISWEMFTRNPVDNPMGDALLGFSLISAILLIPWLLVSSIFLGVFFALRRVFHKASAPVYTRIESVGAVAAPVPLQVTQVPKGNHVPISTIEAEPGTVEGLRYTSPDRTICVELDPVEWFNSHWVNSPRVNDLVTGTVVLDLWGNDWDAMVSFPGPRQVLLSCRRYHFGGGLTVLIDLAKSTYQIIAMQNFEGSLPAAPVSQIVQGLDNASRRSVTV